MRGILEGMTNIAAFVPAEAVDIVDILVTLFYYTFLFYFVLSNLASQIFKQIVRGQQKKKLTW